MDPAAQAALALLLILVVWLGAATAIALLTAQAPPGPIVVSLTDIYDVIADATRITREAAQ